MSRFYLTLPSNSSMDYYPDNTVARYTTKLANTVEVEGEWEVGLTEISFPSQVENVIEGYCYYDIYYDDRFLRRITMPGKHYKRMRRLIENLHKEQREQMPLADHEPLLAQFVYQEGRIRMNLHTRFVVQFSPDLAHLLGFEPDVTYRRNISVAKQLPNMIGHAHSAYVYCDLLEHVAVGDTKAPLLRIVDNPSQKRGNVHRVLNPIQYVPLQKKCFDTMEIYIMTDTGVPVPFLFGKSFAVLEFRRTVHPYFAI